MERLDFEKPIVELEEQLCKAIQLGKDTDVDVTKTVNDIEGKLDKLRKDIYGSLSAWQKVQISRHPNRPYTLDYIEALTKGDFIELHGDRTVKDDKAMIGGWGTIDGQSVMLIGQQKGKNTKSKKRKIKE
jgi:acetyl-CoA carboxylase carboxyl transferase subunit alpha